MILIYSDTSTSRLQYIAAFIFKEILQTPYSITTHKPGFSEFDGIKLNYSGEKLTIDELYIPNIGLLFEKEVKPQLIQVDQFEDFKIFFQKSSKSHNEFPFDIFSACFYLLSRYEEYLPHEKDKYGRYSHLNSLAYSESFLHLPLINIWIKYFKDFLEKRFKKINSEESTFSFLPTYDIDIAYAYLQKGFVRNAFGNIQSLLKLNFKNIARQLKVLSGIEKDPYDNYGWLNELHDSYKLNPVYFFLVPGKNGVHDRNILREDAVMKQLIFNHSEKYSIGLHPSWQSGNDFSLLEKEKKTLESISRKDINKSRQHYLRFNLPDGYKRLIEAGITEDYSMGYGAVNGFRASVASSFLWYDLEKELQTSLRVYPFCYMDSNVIFHEKLSYDGAYEQIINYYNVCKKVQGTFISIFHNHLMGDDNLEWRNVYERFLTKVSGDNQCLK